MVFLNKSCRSYEYFRFFAEVGFFAGALQIQWIIKNKNRCFAKMLMNPKSSREKMQFFCIIKNDIFPPIPKLFHWRFLTGVKFLQQWCFACTFEQNIKNKTSFVSLVLCMLKTATPCRWHRCRQTPTRWTCGIFVYPFLLKNQGSAVSTHILNECYHRESWTLSQHCSILFCQAPRISSRTSSGNPGDRKSVV